MLKLFFVVALIGERKVAGYKLVKNSLPSQFIRTSLLNWHCPGVVKVFPGRPEFV